MVFKRFRRSPLVLLTFPLFFGGVLSCSEAGSVLFALLMLHSGMEPSFRSVKPLLSLLHTLLEYEAVMSLAHSFLLEHLLL